MTNDSPSRAIGWGCGAVLLALAMLLLFGMMPARAAELTPQQEGQAKRIEGELIAPCCWTQTVRDHQSAIADQMRAEIRTMLAGGSTEAQIISTYKDRYGQAILAAPDKKGFGLLAYLLPAAAVAVALVALVLMARRWRSPGAPRAPVVAGSPGAETPHALHDQMEAEVRDFEW